MQRESPKPTNLNRESIRCQHSFTCIDHNSSITSNDIATTSNMYLEPSLMDKRVSLIKTEHEMAGGIEDWEDVHGEDVDRYGFITLRKEPSRGGTPEPRAPQRVSTVSSPVFLGAITQIA